MFAQLIFKIDIFSKRNHQRNFKQNRKKNQFTFVTGMAMKTAMEVDNSNISPVEASNKNKFALIL